MKNTMTISRRGLLKGASAGLALTSLPLMASENSGPIVQTAQGKLEGNRVGDVNAFLGVRYAQSIAGKNRFAPPQPLEAWEGVRSAKIFAPASPQQPRGKGRTPVGIAFADDPSVIEGDDCLAINIWAPANAKGKLPVMVWLHGGGFSAGSGSSPLTQGTNLANRGDVVVVTVNHRLAASGYVDFSRVLGGDFANSSNLGTKDIIAALGWVNENIAAFGGNPANVTIFGESGGGWKVASVLGSPAAKGLVHKAVIQSGPLFGAMSHEDADAVANIMLEELRITKDNAHKLHEVTWQEVVAAEKRASARFSRKPPGFPSGFWIVLDDDTIVDHVFDPIANAQAKDIPVLMGQTGTEMALFMMGDKAAYEFTPEQFAERVQQRYAANADAYIASYRENFPDKTPSYQWFRLVSDITMGALFMKIGKAKTDAGGAPVYSYRFEQESPIMDGKLYSPHTLEIPFVFDTANEVEGAMITGGGEQVANVAKTVSEVWVQFAKTGKPGAPGLPDWPEYTPEKLETMHLGPNNKTGNYIDPAIAPLIYNEIFGKKA